MPEGGSPNNPIQMTSGMNICQSHWTKLVDAMKARGLEKYFGEHGTMASAKVRRWQQGEATLETFEPLLLAYMTIIAHFLDHQKEPVEALQRKGCMLCEVDKHTQLGQNWINGAANDQLEMAKFLGAEGL